MTASIRSLTAIACVFAVTGCSPSGSVDSSTVSKQKHSQIISDGDVPIRETDVVDKTTEFTLVGEDKAEYKVTVETVFRFGDQIYTVVNPVQKEKPKALMRLIPQGEQATFQVIEDDAEFERVSKVLDEHPELLE